MTLEEFARLLGAPSVGLLAGSALGYYTARADERKEQHARQDPQ
jgi:hypothetical protein